MQLTIKGKQIDIGEALRQHIADTVETTVAKYFNHPIEATIVISKQAHLYRAEISVHAGRGIMMQGEAEAGEPYPAFDSAVDKVAKRLRRHKGKLRNHHPHNGSAPSIKANQYILEAEPEHDAHDDLREAMNGSGEGHDDQPVIVAEMTTTIESLTVSEAVLRLDLGELPALMFRNRGHGGLNMIYRRSDGHIGWIDPTAAETAAGEKITQRAPVAAES